MKLAALNGFPTPPPPPPPGSGYMRILEQINESLDLPRGKAGVLAETTARYGRTASDAINAWEAAYEISSVDRDEATVLAMVGLVAGTPPNAISDAYEAAYAIGSVSDSEARDLATRIVLRGYDPKQLEPTHDRLYDIDDVSAESAESMTRAAVSALATPDQVADAYTWYRSQPGGDATQATRWTVDHLQNLSGGFDAWHDELLADLRQRIRAAN